MDSLYIKMLGGFSIDYGEKTIDDQNNRMRKVWLLLAYLIFTRNSPANQNHYLELLQDAGGAESADPAGRLKAMFHRTRNLLNQLCENAGHEWIIRKNGTYAWNSSIPLIVDVEEFERLFKESETECSPPQKLSLLKQALDIYRGDFLPKLAVESWVMPINAYYHQMYITAAERALNIMREQNLWKETVELCGKALKIEPYHEAFYQHLMRGHIALKNRPAALRAYDELSELLFYTFGVMPAEESRLLYREAAREEESFSMFAGTIREQHKEPSGAKGALYCEYDFFNLLYQVHARSILRSGEVIHIALFSIHSRREKLLSRRSLDLALSNLQKIVLSNLRQGDVVTRCSASQLIVMLPQANYEDSRAVCQRLLKAFEKQYPHSPADIHYSIQPLEPHSAANKE